MPTMYYKDYSEFENDNNESKDPFNSPTMFLIILLALFLIVTNC